MTLAKPVVFNVTTAEQKGGLIVISVTFKLPLAIETTT